MKGMALQVRERVRMLLNLVAHAVRYKMMVGVHNTVVVRRMWEVLPYSPCMVDDGAHNTIDVQSIWGEPYRVCLVWELMALTTL